MYMSACVYVCVCKRVFQVPSSKCCFEYGSHMLNQFGMLKIRLLKHIDNKFLKQRGKIIYAATVEKFDHDPITELDETVILL